MGYLSDIINDARRDYRVTSRQAFFDQTHKAAQSTFEAPDDAPGEAAATTADNDSISLGRGDPSPGKISGETWQPGTYDSTSPIRFGEVSTKAELSVYGEVSALGVASLVSPRASDFDSVADPERGKSDVKGKPNRIPRHKGRPASTYLDTHKRDHEKTNSLQRNISDVTQEKMTRSCGFASDMGEAYTGGGRDVRQKGAFQGEGSMKQLIGLVFPNPSSKEIETENIPSPPEGEGKGGGLAIAPNPSGTLDSTPSAETSSEAATTLNSGQGMIGDRRREVESPILPDDSVTAAVDEMPELGIPSLSGGETAEPMVPPPQVVIGSIEVVIEAAPTVQTSRPIAQFSRDPGRFYLKRL